MPLAQPRPAPDSGVMLARNQGTSPGVTLAPMPGLVMLPLGSASVLFRKAEVFAMIRTCLAWIGRIFISIGVLPLLLTLSLL